jgi:hypothetical protein
MYKPFTLTNEEITIIGRIIQIVAPNLSKKQLFYIQGINEFATVDRSVAIPVTEFVYDIIIHKYVTNILFNGLLKNAQEQNTAINVFIKTLCEKNTNGSHLLKFAIQQIDKDLKMQTKQSK